MRGDGSQDDSPTVPVDFGLGPLGADNGVDRDRVLLVHSSVGAPLAAWHVLARFDSEYDIILLSR